MRTAAWIAMAVTLACAPTSAFAYTSATDDGSACVKDKACNVYCDDRNLAGVMYWNGSQWSDGVRSDEDMNVVAAQIVAAQGSSCT